MASSSDSENTYIKFLTKEMFDAEDGFVKLRPIVPNFTELQKCCADIMPSLATVLMRMSTIDFTATESE